MYSERGTSLAASGKLDSGLPDNGLEGAQRDVSPVPVNHGDSAVRVNQLVMVGPAHVDESRFFKFFDEFPCVHDISIRIMRITVKKIMRIMRIRRTQRPRRGGLRVTSLDVVGAVNVD